MSVRLFVTCSECDVSAECETIPGAVSFACIHKAMVGHETLVSLPRGIVEMSGDPLEPSDIDDFAREVTRLAVFHVEHLK
jgi:hypothetical protein